MHPKVEIRKTASIVILASKCFAICLFWESFLSRFNVLVHFGKVFFNALFYLPVLEMFSLRRYSIGQAWKCFHEIEIDQIYMPLMILPIGPI
jgi:hypothetical protein